MSVSLDAKLLNRFDSWIARSKYPTRSEGVKSIMREKLLDEKRAGGDFVAAAITISYDHHRAGLARKTLEAQHRFSDLIVSSQHIHLGPRRCLEIVAARGVGARIEELTRSLKAIKGIEQVKFLIVPGEEVCD